MIFVASKNGKTKIFFPPPLLVLLLDTGWIKIRIRDKHIRSATLDKSILVIVKSEKLCTMKDIANARTEVRHFPYNC
jgi:hypothetical protein